MDDWETSPESEEQRRFEANMDIAIEQSYQTLKAHRWVRLVREWRRRRAFKLGLIASYAPAFEWFDHFLITVQEVGSEANERLRGLESEDRDYVVDVLTRLHARACLVSSEIRALMVSGHASGALARWRTLHEISVVACLVRQEGNDVAERYLLHDTIRRAKALRKLMKYERRLGLEQSSTEDFELVFREEADLIERFGDHFGSEWGWAVGALKGIPNFARIEEHVRMDHWRPQFGWANNSVHAGFAGTASDIGYGSFEFTDFALTGPSIYGISEPATYTLLALYNCTVALASYKGSDRQYVQLGVLERLGAECTNVFLKVGSK